MELFPLIQYPSKSNCFYLHCSLLLLPHLLLRWLGHHKTSLWMKIRRGMIWSQVNVATRSQQENGLLMKLVVKGKNNQESDINFKAIT